MKLTVEKIRELIKEETQKFLNELDQVQRAGGRIYRTTGKEFTRPNYSVSKEFKIKYPNVAYDIPNVGIEKLKKAYLSHYINMGVLEKMLAMAKKTEKPEVIKRYQDLYDEGNMHIKELQAHSRWNDLKKYFEENPKEMRGAEDLRKTYYSQTTHRRLQKKMGKSGGYYKGLYTDIVDMQKVRDADNAIDAAVRKSRREDGKYFG